MNVHGACAYCNRWLHGNLAEYYIRLVKDYGQHKVDELMKLKRLTVKMSRQDYLDKISEFEGKLKDSSLSSR